MSDLISRQAAIEHLKKRLYETELNSTEKYPYYEEIADNRIDTWMNEVPPAQPEQRWIPCSERLPEHKCEEYLCTSKWLEEDTEEVKVLEWGRVSKTANDCKKHPEMIAGRTFDGWGFGEDWYGKIDNVEKVSAWMPLPEPYKEGDE